MNTDKKEKAKNPSKTDWLRNFAIGLLLFISGILSKFFPATVMTVTYVVTGVVFALIGISDGVSALKYKETGSDWKLILIMGGLSVICAVYFIPAVIYLYSINISIYVVSAWLVLRGILNIAGLAKGTLRRKNVLLWAVVMIASGIFSIFFCEQIISYSTSYLAYILIASGVLLAFYGIYQKTDEKEKKEKELREEAIRKGFEESVIPAKGSELIPAPEETVASENTPVPDTAEAEKPGKDAPAEAEKPAPAENAAENISEEKTSDDIIEVEAEEIETPEAKTQKKGLFDSFFKK